jgi:hypothetical protein
MTNTLRPSPEYYSELFHWQMFHIPGEIKRQRVPLTLVLETKIFETIHLVHCGIF